MPDRRTTLIAAWAVFGVTALLGQAVARLLPLALEPIADGSLGATHLALYGVWVLFNAYVEGYRAFQKRFCPRVVGRAFHLGSRPHAPLHVLLAAPYSMGLFYARRRNLLVSWGLVSAIVTLVILVRLLPQPFRGIVDGGVVVGLVWGIVSLWVLFLRVLSGGRPPEPEGLPAV